MSLPSTQATSPSLRCIDSALGLLQKDAKEILEQAAADEFESVIVLGYKGGSVFIQASSLHSRLQILGALEAAKIHLWTEG